MKINRGDQAWIFKVAERYEQIMEGLALEPQPRLTTIMELSCCHARRPLLLASLASVARDEDVVHDVAGINRHLDHEIGKLTDGFVPRYSELGIAKR